MEKPVSQMRVSASSVEQDGQFLLQFPDYMRYLDPGREAAYIRARLSSVERQDEPFPYVWVEDVLSPELYALLKAAWPVIDAFPAEERANRRDLVPRPPGTSPSDKRASTYNDLPASLRAVWDFFVIEVNRGIIGPWLAATFRASIASAGSHRRRVA